MTFIGFPALEGEPIDIAKSVLDHAWARLTVSLKKGVLKYKVRFHGETESKELKVTYANKIGQGLHADIAFTPKRKDAFLGVKVLRPQIWSWIRGQLRSRRD